MTTPRFSIHPRLAGALLALEAASLAVMSALHLSGALAGGSSRFEPNRAGIAEAIIGIALAAGAAAVLRAPRRGRQAGLAAVAFAVVGFAVGLSITARDGGAVDIAYHAGVLPLLILTGVLLLRAGGERTPPPAPAGA